MAAGLPAVLLLTLWPSRTRAACRDHTTCTACIADAWGDFSCLWYVGPYSTYGTCLTGQVGASPAPPDTGDARAGSFSVWTGHQSYTLYDVDEFSEGSCSIRTGELEPECGPGTAVVSNTPYYGTGTSYPEYRNLKCCHQQRNMDGFLRGFDAINGVVSGDVYFATCCSSCPLGSENVDCDVTAVTSGDGECQFCPTGKYNDIVTIGSTCKTCPPCEPGAARECGGAVEGSCVECVAGSTYKEAGLEGSWSQVCGPCEGCRAGYQRTGCGPVSQGRCEPCPQGEYFASPNCRACSACVSFGRMGCALLSEGMCPPCAHGKWGSSAQSCQVCQTCGGEPVTDVAVNGLTLSGPMQRAGCGGGAGGECVRLAAALGDWEAGALCPTASWNQTVCQGVRPRLRWVLQGLAAEQLGVAGGNCTAEAGLCLTGLWSVSLQRRTALAPSGETARELQEWWAPDLEPDDAGAGLLAFEEVLPALEAGLPAGGGYFLRLDLVDRGGSWSDASPVSAVTADFALAEPAAAVEAALGEAAAAMALGDRGAAVEAAAVGCSAGSPWPAEVTHWGDVRLGYGGLGLAWRGRQENDETQSEI
ncbi:unnamed protein product [Prorocentrum cordatum]|uniref:TNFR-Cys domain-containing protein n=1 Tax=Prorocentrum cordatum TaxID=2364126 RepID=A0ABN9T2T3_9DINO|nr:unnamed protein product [Polarella glacialis]